MASRTDVSEMIVEELRPSLLALLREELSHLVELKAELAGPEGCAVAPAKRSSGVLSRIDRSLLKTCVDRQIESRLNNLEDRLTEIQRNIDDRNAELGRLMGRLVGLVDRLEDHFAAAAETLRSKLRQLQQRDAAALSEANRLLQRGRGRYGGDELMVLPSEPALLATERPGVAQ